ncbi:MAG: hypothetical protein WC663_00755 [Patescibacteria group bacterium]|jgi:hypothetical protein
MADQNKEKQLSGFEQFVFDPKSTLSATDQMLAWLKRHEEEIAAADRESEAEFRKAQPIFDKF